MVSFDCRELSCVPPYFQVHVHAILHEQFALVQQGRAMCNERRYDMSVGVYVGCEAVYTPVDSAIWRFASPSLQLVACGRQVVAVHVLHLYVVCVGTVVGWYQLQLDAFHVSHITCVIILWHDAYA